MIKLLNWLKAKLPTPIKNLLRPMYHHYKQWHFKRRPTSYNYQQQKEAEINRFNDEEEVNDLPAIFHYWSNKYLVPKLQAHGFSNPNDFFLKYARETINATSDKSNILSIGAGNCDTEVMLAKQLCDLGLQNFTIDCMDINEMMFKRGMALAENQGVTDKIKFKQADFNEWQADTKYDLIIANQSLHHVSNLEHLYDNIEMALKTHGKFITSDVIGRNGHQRWPEALEVIQRIWKDMPDRYKSNHSLKRFEKKYINHDCSIGNFEGIRAQDVLPLLANKFNFELFIPFANLIMVFIDRSFGPNFDVNNPVDLAFIDHVHQLDEEMMQKRIIKPTQMLAVMSTRHKQKTTMDVSFAIKNNN